MKIIDGHAHICKYINGIGSEGELIPIGNGYATYASGKTIKMIPDGYGDTGFSYEMLIKVMDEYQIERAVLLQGNYLGLQNLYTAKAVKKYPNRFKGAFMVDPFSYNLDKILNHLVFDLNFKIMKLECSNGSGLMANHSPFSLLDPKMRYLYDFARKNHITVVMDIGRPNNPCYQIDTLNEIVKEYSDVTFVICHLTAVPFDNLDLLVHNLTLLNHKNVYFDTASVMNNTKEPYPFNCARGYIRKAIDILGMDKIIFGTDIPCGISKHSMIENLNYLKIDNLFTDEELEHIFYLNAKKVYFNE